MTKEERIALCEKYVELREQKKVIEEQMAALKEELSEEMGNHKTMDLGSYHIEKSQGVDWIDTKELKHDDLKTFNRLARKYPTKLYEGQLTIYTAESYEKHRNYYRR